MLLPVLSFLFPFAIKKVCERENCKRAKEGLMGGNVSWNALVSTERVEAFYLVLRSDAWKKHFVGCYKKQSFNERF